MHVLIIGSTGFIGRHLAQALRGRGHSVMAARRDSIDFAAGRVRLPPGVDAVVNAAGLFRERGGGASFDAVHARGPCALFDACAAAGVARVVQVSALGANADAPTAFLRSKHAADAHLLALPLDATVVQPSLVYGDDGDSAATFRTLAALPIVPLPAGGDQPVQPVHVDDVVAVIGALLESRDGPWRSRRVALVGPRALPLRQYLGALRAGLRLAPARTIEVPSPVLNTAAALADAVRSGLFGRDAWRMLRQGSVADAADIAALLGHPPRPVEKFIAPEHADALRTQATVAGLLPLLRLSLALLWLWTAAVSLGLYPVAESLELLGATGLPAPLSRPTLISAAALDALLGVLTLAPLRPRARRRLWAAQALLVLGYTAIITVRLPAFWLHPFGPISKNLPILALLALLWALDRRRGA